MGALTYVPEAFQRHWLPAGTELKTWEQIEPWFQQLLERPLDSAAELETWLRDCGELGCAVSQEGVKRYIAMTCQTDDPAREAAHLAFVREIEPRLKPLQHALRKKYLDCPHRAQLSPQRYHVFDRAQANRRDLYRAANIPRETALAELDQQYQKRIGALTVTFRGEERTLSQMAPFLEEPDRQTREEAWKLVAQRRLAEREALDDLFDHMVALRLEIAHEAGFETYVDYAYRNRERFDYGPDQAAQFRLAIEQVVVPLARAIHEKRGQELGLESLRPWDLSVDPQSRPPLRPFSNPEQLAAGAETIFSRVDPELGAQFAFMRTQALLDTANRKGKAPGGYQTTLEDDRFPFIFMNAVGIDGDLRTLLHEGGHAFHALAARGEPLAAYRDSPIEFCEVASMSMELLGARHLDVFYNSADTRRSLRHMLEEIVLILPWIATIDEFQHWIYTHPGCTRAERRAAWTPIHQRYSGAVDWTGLEEVRASLWHRQLHIFLYPFYYIEYGIAQLGALQVWRRARTDPAAAVADYRRALSLGGARTLPELFDAAGIHFAFTAEILRPLMQALQEELEGIGV